MTSKHATTLNAAATIATIANGRTLPAAIMMAVAT